MPTAPTINSITDAGGYLLISYTNVGAGDHNQLWRMTSDEYGGVSIKIADPLGWNTSVGLFRDYEAASGKTYTYQMVAVDGATTAASATMSASLTLSSAWLHAIAIGEVEGGAGLLLQEDDEGLLFEDGDAIELEGVVISNASLALQLTDLAPHSRSYELASVSRLVANAQLPKVGIGYIERTQIAPPVIIPYGNDDRRTLRAIYTSPYYACLRDAFGNKWIGRLLPPTEIYGGTFADIGLVLEVLSFDEAVA